MNRKLFFLFGILFFSAAALTAQPKQTVRVTPGFATVIVCPVAPELVTVGNLDAFSIQTAGNYILVKPLMTRGTTNMFIKAGSDSYNLLLQIADNPDLEVRLSSSQDLLEQIEPGKSNSEIDGQKDKNETALKKASVSRRQPLTSLNRKAVSALSSLFKTQNRYTYSVNNSKVIFAIDHIKQIRDKFFVIATIVNNSNIPYDVGYVRFSLIDYTRSYVFWKKKLKETEIEPTNEFYNTPVNAHSSGRLLFIFDKHGFSENSTFNVKCNEESGRRDLILEVPGAMIK
ncbi:MAG: DUF4138 domain-containing protein [bacterium]|nr:DUF4138 domain-containing protein [bacterium]